MSWLPDFFKTLRVAAAGVVLPQQFAINFPAPFTATPNSGTNQTDIGLGTLPSPSLIDPIISGTTEYDGPSFGSHGGSVKTFSKQFGVETPGNAVTTLATIALDDLTATSFTGEITAKHAAAADCLMEKIAIGYVRNGGAPVVLGTFTESDTRKNGTTTGWAVTQTVSGNNLLIQVQGAAATNIEWTLLGQWIKTTST